MIKVVKKRKTILTIHYYELLLKTIYCNSENKFK